MTLAIVAGACKRTRRVVRAPLCAACEDCDGRGYRWRTSTGPTPCERCAREGRRG